MTGIYQIKYKDFLGKIQCDRNFAKSEEEARQGYSNIISVIFVPQNQWTKEEHADEAIASRYC